MVFLSLLIIQCNTKCNMFNCRYDFLSFYTDNSDAEDGSPRKKQRSSSSPSGSDPNRNKSTAGNLFCGSGLSMSVIFVNHPLRMFVCLFSCFHVILSGSLLTNLSLNTCVVACRPLSLYA